MENQPTKLDKAVKISIIVGILLMAFYFLYSLPSKERKLENARKECWSESKNYAYSEYFFNRFKLCMSEKGFAD